MAVVTELTADALAVARSLTPPALAHGVNTRGVMGAGIAKTIRAAAPGLYKPYQEACRTGALTPGGCLTWTAPNGGTIFNLATQDKPGPHARLDWIESALAAMADDAARHGITRIAMPRIGCGIGGLTWTDVRPLLAATPGNLELLVATPPH